MRLAKSEIAKWPVVGTLVSRVGTIFIERSRRRTIHDVLQIAAAHLSEQELVSIFPEGTRISPGQRGKYHIGGAWLATHTGTQVVPVAHNAGKFWPKPSMLKQPGVIQISIGKPIESLGLKSDALNKKVEAWIEAEMLTLNNYPIN